MEGSGQLKLTSYSSLAIFATAVMTLQKLCGGVFLSKREVLVVGCGWTVEGALSRGDILGGMACGDDRCAWKRSREAVAVERSALDPANGY